MRVPLVVLIALLLACSRDASEKTIERALVRAGGAAELAPAVPTTSLPASEVLSMSPAFGIPYRVRAIRRMLLVADQARGPTLHVIDAESGALLRSLGRWGRGPGEFESVVSIDTLKDPSGALSLFDYNQQRITIVAMDSLESSGIHVLETVRLDWRPESVAHLRDGRLLAVNASDSSIVQIIDGNGRRMQHRALATVKVPPNDSLFLRSAYKGRVCGVRGEQAAIAFRFTSNLSIVDIASGRDIAADVPHAFGPSFIETPLIGKRTFKGGAPGVRYAYIDCIATDNAIYALFSGRLVGKYDRSRDNAGRYVHRFDWAGQLTASWKLDHDAFGLAAVGSMLITIAEDDAPALKRTRMPVENPNTGAK